MNFRIIGVFQILVGILIVTVTVFMSYEVLIEAYGKGSPYYSRTTNMDKWSDPIPGLLAIDFLSLFIVMLLLRSGLRRIRMKYGKE
jgi:hypothetical protein